MCGDEDKRGRRAGLKITAVLPNSIGTDAAQRRQLAEDVRLLRSHGFICDVTTSDNDQDGNRH